VKIELVGDKYVATLALSEKQLVEDAGFIFDRLITRKWYTKDWKKAAILLDYCVGAAEIMVSGLLAEHEAKLNASYSMFAEADIPRPHLVNHKGQVLDYLPYQKAGILYAAERDDTLIADSPGLGKTIQAIGLINYLDIRSGVIVCPSTLKLNWLKEMTKWLVDKSLRVKVCNGSDFPSAEEADFVIINYDILKRNAAKLHAEHWGILVCDEAQYLQNPKSGRTETVFGQYIFDYKVKKWFRKRGSIGKQMLPLMIRADRRVMLTGTPMMKKPADMWTIIRDFDPNGLGKNFDNFAYTYCDAYDNGFGVAFPDEHGNPAKLEELNEILRKTFMIRRLKANVLKDLPRKTREAIILPAEGLKKKIKTERDKFTDALGMLNAVNLGEEWNPKVALEEADPAKILDTMAYVLGDGFERAHVSELDAGEVQPGFAAFSEARHELALSKVPMAIEHIKRLVDAGEKVIVFAIHRDVVQSIYEAFPTAGRIIGGMPAKKVEAEKLRFQGDLDKGIAPDPDCRVMLANLKAGGVGHTLTEATVVVFVEMWSVPGDMEQCEDRAHRIGLEHNVLIQYLVVDGTIDAMTIQSLMGRIEMIQRGVDGVEPINLRKAA
jgi:SNF2 family DNA or RNA helicase